MAEDREFDVKGFDPNGGGNTNKTAVLRALWNNLYPIVRESGGELFGGVTRTVLKPVTGEETAKQAGELASNTFKAGVTVSANVRDFTKVAQDSRKRMKSLVSDVAPFLEEEFGKASRGKLMRSKNEVLQVERTRIMELTKNGFFTAGAGLVDKLPEVFVYVDHKREEIAAGKEAGEAAKFGDIGVKLDEMGTKLAKAEVFNKENRTLIETAVRTGAPVVQGYIAAEGKDRSKRVTAFDMIRDLAEQAKTDRDGIGTVYNKELSEHQTLSEYIVDVFKKHQEDTKGAPINDRFRFLPELEEASKAIAKEIDQNLLDPFSLVSLVGERKVLDSHMRVASPEKIEGELQRVRRSVEKAEKVDANEFIAETAFATKEDFKEILDGLPEGEKAFFVSLFPQNVLKDIGGLKDAEIDALKDKGAAEFSEKVVQAIEEIGKLDEKELQRYGLTKQEGELVRGFAEALDDLGKQDVVDALQGAEKQAITDALRNARGYWQHRISDGAVKARETADRSDEKPEEKRETSDSAKKDGEGKDSPASKSFAEREETKVGAAKENAR